jgi:dTDP-4-amino-4,6-dideoxygalactose transaminase
MVTTNDAALADRLRRLRHHGMSVSDLERHVATRVTIEEYGELGYNYRMTDLQAAVGLVQMTRLGFMLERRRELAAAYTGAFEKHDALIPPFCPEGSVHSWQSYLLRLNDTGAVRRDELMQRLLDRGIATRRGIMAIHQEPAYRAVLREGSLPNTERAAATSLILPLYVQMAGEEQEVVIETLMDCLTR